MDGILEASFCQPLDTKKSSAFSVYYYTWMVNCQKVQFRMHPWKYLNARKEWTEFSRQVSADHWTQRKVLHFLYITTPGWLTAEKCSSECIHEGILMRGKNGRNSRGEFPLTTGHIEKWRSEHRSTTVGWRAFGEEKNVRSSKKRMGV